MNPIVPIGMAIFLVVAVSLFFRTAWPLLIAGVFAGAALALGAVVYVANAVAGGESA